MLYQAAIFFALTLLASFIAFGDGEAAEGGQYAAVMFALAFVVSLMWSRRRREIGADNGR